MLPDSDPLADADALIAEGRADEAVRRLAARLDAGRGGLLLRLTLVRARLATGDNTGALADAREIALSHPQAAAAAVCLGEALLANGQLPTAIGEFQRALRLDPDFMQSRYLLGCAWLEAGEAEKALEAFRAIEDKTALNTVEKVAEAEAMQKQQRSDPRYVRHLFDQFSTDYDVRMLGQLSYSAPAILRDLASMLGLTPPHRYKILDLGCGTGLSGQAFMDVAARLDGVDLSPAMIEKARERGIYDSLQVGDIELVLASEGLPYDFILAADTLVYLGDLHAILTHAVPRLKPGGLFLFTVEKCGGAGFELGPKRRWRHSETYIRAESSAAGLDVAGLLACSPRSEAGIPVEGLAVALQRPDKD